MSLIIGGAALGEMVIPLVEGQVRPLSYWDHVLFRCLCFSVLLSDFLRCPREMLVTNFGTRYVRHQPKKSIMVRGNAIYSVCLR